MTRNYQKIYTVFFTFSLLLFLINFLVQGKIVFGYEDFLGLILKIEGIFWIGFSFLVILVFYHYLNFKKMDEKYVYLTFSILIIYLIGSPIFYEHLPRFPDTWSHSYLTSEMFRTGNVINKISPYEQYPGSFLFFGLIFEIFQPYSVMSFFPIFIYFFGLVIIYLLFKILTNSRTSFLSCIIYMIFNWTVEDNHLSPQFLMLFVYFVFMFILVKMLTDKKNKNKYFLFNLIIIPVIVFSHPGLPIFLILILTTMIFLCKKFRFTISLVLIFLIFCFISHTLIFTSEAKSYISFLDNFIKSFLSGQFSQVTQSFETTLPFRKLFLSSRLCITAFSIIIGLLGLIFMYNKRYSTGAKFLLSWSFSMVLFVFFVGVVLKGEYYERFVLISSLPLALSTVYFMNEIRVPKIYFLIFFLAMSPLYFISKYGNEGFESTSLQKIKASCYYFTENPDCFQTQTIVDNKVFLGIESIGETNFIVSREDEMWNSINLDEDIDTLESSIEKLVFERKLNRVYSTEISAVYEPTG